MKIDWTKQPTPEHCWLEAIVKAHQEESGWYVLNGTYWAHENKERWFADGEGDDFTVHRKPEEYVPKVGEWCLSKMGVELFYVGENVDGLHIMELINGQLIRYTGLSEFKPLPPKTEEELFVEAAQKATDSEQFTIFTKMYRSGFKAPD